MAENPTYCPATMRRVGTRRAKNRARRKASSMFVAAKVATLADNTPRYRYTMAPALLYVNLAEK
jgi:hypothetical protein